jgi:hypothetical protein
MPFGRSVINTGGRGVCVSADGNPRWKAAGLTLDWATVTAVSGSDVTLDDGTVVIVGDKYILFGTVLKKITSGGKYGPVDTGASDGREVVTAAVRGDAFILNETVVYSRDGDIIGGVFDGGLVYKDRLNIGGSGEPTEANIETMFPDITFVNS